MKAELTLNRSNRKIDIDIIAGNNKTVFISIPKRNEEMIHFHPNEPIEITYYKENKMYRFQTLFSNVERFRHQWFYRLIIQEVNESTNVRKEERQNVEIPSIVFGDFHYVFATILDLSSSGAKIETSAPFPKKDIILFYENEKECWIKGSIIWEKKENEKYYCGVSFQDKV